MDENGEKPHGELTMRVPAMPRDSNSAGDVFGGWVMSQMDLAAGVRGAERAGGRVATVAVNALTFRKPVKIGDTLSIYSSITAVGRSSITLLIEAWAQRHLTREQVKVTEGTFVMVALDREGKPTALPPDPNT